MSADTDGVGAQLPGGVADAAGRTGYFASVSGGIDAVELETGRLLWNDRNALDPLLFSRNRLFATALLPGKPNALQIIAIDGTGDGRQVLGATPIVFPEWVSVRPVPGHSFHATAHILDDTLQLRWVARSRYMGGAPPPPEVLSEFERDAAGVARIDLNSDRIEMLPADTPWLGKIRDVPPDVAGWTSYPYWMDGRAEQRPFFTDRVAAVLQMQRTGDLQTILLRRWDLDATRQMPVVALAEGRQLAPLVSLDEKYVFVQGTLPPNAESATARPWWVFSVDSGERVATLHHEQSAISVAIIGPRVYYAVSKQASPNQRSPLGLTLKAVDLQTGGVIWERLIRDRGRENPALPP